jgi:hypothetical protein
MATCRRHFGATRESFQPLHNSRKQEARISARPGIRCSCRQLAADRLGKVHLTSFQRCQATCLIRHHLQYHALTAGGLRQYCSNGSSTSSTPGLLPNLRGICVTIDESTLLGQIPVWRRAENVRSEPEAGVIGALMKASGHVETLNGPFRHQRTAKAPQFAALGAHRVHQLLHRTQRGRNSTVRQMRITAAWQMPAAPNIGSPSVPPNAPLYTAGRCCSSL